MNNEDFECQFCGAEGEIGHAEEDAINFCPFCGEELYVADEDGDDYADEDEE